MKNIFTVAIVFIASYVFGQSSTETEIIQLSNDKFRWLQQGKYDSVADLLDERLVFVHSNGATQSKTEYLNGMKNSAAVYDTIDLKETAVRIYDNTAILVGKGRFVITMNQKQGTYNLVYTEVYVKQNNQWKLASRQTSQATD